MTVPLERLPVDACDCHTHVFLDPAAFPFAPRRRYTPPPAGLEALMQWQDRLGLGRVVIVQPSVYADDPAALVHALRALGPQRARGVASLGPNTTEDDLDALHAVGVRGVRVNLEIHEESDTRRATADLRRAADRLAPRGWHVQVYANLKLLADCADVLADLPVPLVLDHFAGWRVGASDSATSMPAALMPVIDLLESGRAWVKLSAAYRVSPRGAADPAVAAVARRLLAANPDRVVWGSDWPHPDPSPAAAVAGVHAPFAVDVADTLTHLRDWCDADPALLHRVLVDNPARLYDFTP